MGVGEEEVEARAVTPTTPRLSRRASRDIVLEIVEDPPSRKSVTSRKAVLRKSMSWSAGRPRFHRRDASRDLMEVMMETVEPSELEELLAAELAAAKDRVTSLQNLTNVVATNPDVARSVFPDAPISALRDALSELALAATRCSAEIHRRDLSSRLSIDTSKEEFVLSSSEPPRPPPPIQHRFNRASQQQTLLKQIAISRNPSIVLVRTQSPKRLGPQLNDLPPLPPPPPPPPPELPPNSPPVKISALRAGPKLAGIKHLRSSSTPPPSRSPLPRRARHVFTAVDRLS